MRKKREAKVTLVDRTFLLCKACALTQQSKAATPALREQTPDTDAWDDAVRGPHDLDVWRWIKRRCLRICRAQSLEPAQSLSLASTADEFGSVLQTHLFIAMSSDPDLSTDRLLAGARRIMSDLPTLFTVVNQIFPLPDNSISIVGCDVHTLFRIEENWLRLVDRHKLPLPMRAVGAVVPPPRAADADSSSNSDRERPTTQWHAGDLQKARSVTISRDNGALNSSSKGPPPAVAPRRNQTFIDGVQARDRAQLTPMYAAGPTRPRSDSVNSVDSIGEPPPPPDDDLTVVDWAAQPRPVPAKDDEFSRSDDDDDDDNDNGSDGEEPPPPVHVEDDDEDEAPPVPPVVTPRTAAATTAAAAPVASRSARTLAQSAAPAPARATSPPVPRRPTADAPAPARAPALQSVSRSPPRRPSDPSATRRPSDPPSTSPTTSPRGLASPRLPQRSDAASPTPPPARSAPAGAATRSVPPATTVGAPPPTAGAPPPLAVVASPSARVAIPAPQRQALPARQPRQAPQQAPARPAAPTRQPSAASPIVRRAARQPTGAVRGPSPASPAVPRAQAPPATALAASDPAVPSADSDDEAPPRPPSADSDDDAPPAALTASDSYQQLPKAPSRMQYCELPQDPSARDDSGDNGDLPEVLPLQDLTQSSVQYQELPKANAIVYEQLPPKPAVQYEVLPQNQNGGAAAPQYDKLPQRDTQNIDDDAKAAAAAAQYAELPLRATDAIDADAAAVKHSTVVITPIPGKQAARTQVNLPVRRAAATTPSRGPPVRTPPVVAAAPSRPVGQPGVVAPTRSRRAPLAVPRRGSAPTPITRSSQQAAATDEDDEDDILGMIEQGAQHAQHEWSDLQRNGGDTIVDVEELSE